MELLGVFGDDLGEAGVGGYLSGDANALTVVFVFGPSKFAAIVAPDHDGENLIGIGAVEIQEGGLAVGGIRKARTDHGAADRSSLSEMGFGFVGGYFLLRGRGDGGRQA